MVIWNLWLHFQRSRSQQELSAFCVTEIVWIRSFLFFNWKPEHELKTRISVVKYGSFPTLACTTMPYYSCTGDKFSAALCFSLFFTGLAVTHCTWKRQNPRRRIDNSLGDEKKKPLSNHIFCIWLSCLWPLSWSPLSP